MQMPLRIPSAIPISRINLTVDLVIVLGDNRRMNTIKDLLSAAAIALVMFGPLFYYFLFMMKP